MIDKNTPKLSEAAPQDLLLISDVSDGGIVKLIPIPKNFMSFNVSLDDYVKKVDTPKVQDTTGLVTKAEFINLKKDLKETRKWLADLGIKFKELNKKC